MTLSFQDVAVTALTSLIQNEKLPDEPTVMSAICHVLYHGVGQYLSPQESDLSKAIGTLVERAFNEEDEAISSLGILDRQVLWATLGALKKVRQNALKGVNP